MVPYGEQKKEDCETVTEEEKVRDDQMWLWISVEAITTPDSKGKKTAILSSF